MVKYYSKSFKVRGTTVTFWCRFPPAKPTKPYFQVLSGCEIWGCTELATRKTKRFQIFPSLCERHFNKYHGDKT